MIKENINYISLFIIYVLFGFGVGCGSKGKNDGAWIYFFNLLFCLVAWPIGIGYYLTKYLRKGE